MLTFHNDEAIKSDLLARLARRRLAGQIVQNGETNWDSENETGDAIGVTLEGWRYQEYETRFGIPPLFARVQNDIFDFLSPTEFPMWPERFISAIPVGVTLDGVWEQLVLWRFFDSPDPLTDCGYDFGQRSSIFNMAQVFRLGVKDESMLNLSAQVAERHVGEHNKADPQATRVEDWKECWLKEAGRQATYAAIFAAQAAGADKGYAKGVIDERCSRAISAAMFVKCSLFSAGYLERARQASKLWVARDLNVAEHVGTDAEAASALVMSNKLCDLFSNLQQKEK